MLQPIMARFEEVYAACEPAVRSYCGRRLHADRVDDAVADVFAVVWRKAAHIPAEPMPWVYGIAHRVLYHQWRQVGRLRRLDAKLGSVTHGDATDAAEIVLQHEEYRMVLAAAARLPLVDQEILRLSLWEELTGDQIASVLGINANAAKQRALRARRRLAEEFRALEARQPTREGGAR